MYGTDFHSWSVCSGQCRLLLRLSSAWSALPAQKYDPIYRAAPTARHIFRPQPVQAYQSCRHDCRFFQSDFLPSSPYCRAKPSRCCCRAPSLHLNPAPRYSCRRIPQIIFCCVKLLPLEHRPSPDQGVPFYQGVRYLTHRREYLLRLFLRSKHLKASRSRHLNVHAQPVRYKTYPVQCVRTRPPVLSFACIYPAKPCDLCLSISQRLYPVYAPPYGPGTPPPLNLEKGLLYNYVCRIRSSDAPARPARKRLWASHSFCG